MESKKTPSAKTLADRLAAGRVVAAESPEPPGEEVPRWKLHRPHRDGSRPPAIAAAPSKPADEVPYEPVRRKNFRDALLSALSELAPQLPNMLRDWRKRRKAIKAFHHSRRQIAAAPAEDDAERNDGDEGEGTEPSVRARPARALPKLTSRTARRARIATWRMFRPLTRWQRRTAPGIVLACYFGVLAVFSLASMAVILLPMGAPPAPQPAPPPAGPGVTMRLGVPARTAVRDPRPDPAAVADLQERADAEFRDGHYAAAEKSFRELLPSARFRPFTGFQIFLCLLKQGKFAEAEILAKKFPAGVGAKNPSGQYVAAALAIVDGRPDDAHEAAAAARSRFPGISPLYDRALSAAALEPKIRTEPEQ